ncbi:hypothetical protein EJ03DRAFT_265161 [Teratosphaeria nubilosa]|uniref:non-specific serine/threonine protein kinase n=1 Tax=Teratosphaeria nubilosa TaxID=161662 RepID=A0A6G1LK05_9PEZI|nr:hypothetical protein EJ03DRAFT_265161 [Teratosphaeria nubilosa]
MAEDASRQGPLAPPAVTALREGPGKDGTSRAHMERTISMDIREEREDLKRAAEQSVSAIMELDLENRVRWVSPSWQNLTNGEPSDIMGKHIGGVLVDDQNVFAECVERMRKDDSKSHIVRFSLLLAPPLNPEDGASSDEKTPVDDKSEAQTIASSEAEGLDKTSTHPAAKAAEATETINLEAQGIMVYDRDTGDESHTMWMVKPAVSREITIDLPDVLIESLGIGAEMLADYLTQLTEEGQQNPQAHPPPMPVLCRICERQITPWWFERHTELCFQEHTAEMQVQLAHEALNEQRKNLVKVLDALEEQSRLAKITPVESDTPLPIPKAEYKGYIIGPTSLPTSGPSSGRSSPGTMPSRSRDSSMSGITHRRARSFAVRRPMARIVELVLDLCDTAIEISTPAIKDAKVYAPGELRTQSPQSESRIQQVLQWQSPSAGSLEHEQGLSLLCDESSQLAKSKVEAVFRHRRILEYSERIRVEYEYLVQECIEAAVEKARRIAAGDLSDSSDDGDYDTPDEQQGSLNQDDAEETPVPQQAEPALSIDTKRFIGSPSAMALALRNASDPAINHRISSAGSSRASSPHGGATTPKSYAGPSESFIFHKRGSLALESDTGAESDSSMRSSVHSATGNHHRSDSPAGDSTLSRMGSRHSRDRKRQSLVLPSLASQNRHQSPARAPPAPSSPLRMAKPRLSGADSTSSPITSPTLSTCELTSPLIRAQHQHHHRRQSSNALASALGAPGSPRLSAVVSNPQPRAVQTSIKDFDIIKPISKGAFGSVYLAKKRSTGDYYAIKVLKKADMVAKNQVTNVKAERAIMMWQGESDFVAKLYWTFANNNYLYLVMEYLNGGDCASLIKVLGALPEDWTKKYLGEVVLCVQHLHSRQIIHRDLKPDNLLIDAKGHLKLTDFGLSRMGLIGRQERAMNAKPGDAPPDLLKSGPFRRAASITSSRSTSFDYQGHHSPAQTPAMTPSSHELSQPSYFSLTRDTSRDQSRRASTHRSNSGDSEALDSMFRRFSVAEGRTPIEEETDVEETTDSPDPYGLEPVASNQSQTRVDTPPQGGPMPPPMLALFDPEDSNRRFVGTPDYLAPETINGAGQDEKSDWWSVGCILFECLYGRPPFNADTPEQVFQNILERKIQWPDLEDDDVSEEAKDLINKLMCSNPADRLGANKEKKYADGGEEIKAHPWFADINWGSLREDEASFIPASENPEDTEYFDARGATMQNFAPEFQEEQSSSAQTPGADYPDRPHDALSRVRTSFNNAVKRNLMPLHIPPHVRDARSRRLSEPAAKEDDFGSFQYKNLPVLEKANKDVIQKLRSDAMQAQAKTASGQNASSSAVVSPSPAPSLESSPILPMPLKRTLSSNKGTNRAQSPSMLSHQSSPSRGSQPSSPLLVSFSAGQSHERRKTSSGSSSLSHTNSNPVNLQPGNFFDQAPRLPINLKSPATAPSPIKGFKLPQPVNNSSGEQSRNSSNHSNVSSPRQRSHTVGSQEGDLVPDLNPAHYKRRSGVFDISPSSSDNEETRQKALLRVQRRRASSRRLSQVSLNDGPSFRTLDVLVCEDHPVSRLVMERQLEKLRCRTIAVTNGAEAMRYAMSEVKFDIIMMEYKLPQVNGADVARMIRETRNPNSHTPIVAVTGYLKELHAPHHFDALVEKPATKEKLEDVMGRLCQWKPAPEGWKPTPPQNIPAIPQSSLRQESFPRDDSPTTTASSGFGGFGHAMSSSYKGSSRGDSVGSSSYGEADGHFESIPNLVVSRQVTSDWETADMAGLERNFGGLGISHNLAASPEPDGKPLPHSTPPLLHHEASAPGPLETPTTSLLRKQPSIEAIQAKRRSLERGRHESAAESGDDEDEELGNISVRHRSLQRPAKRQSKLGTEMMRTNSQGSVISLEDIVAIQNAHKNDSEKPVAEPIQEDPAELQANGHLTPPVLFPPRPGDHTETIEMDRPVSPKADPDATPRPQHITHG